MAQVGFRLHTHTYMHALKKTTKEGPLTWWIISQHEKEEIKSINATEKKKVHASIFKRLTTLAQKIN